MLFTLLNIQIFKLLLQLGFGKGKKKQDNVACEMFHNKCVFHNKSIMRLKIYHVEIIITCNIEVIHVSTME